jgi:hypothetical protein
MKCKFCGARIGILERWRYGDFCSKEHKDEFAEDLVRLNEQIVQDLRRLPKLFKAPSAQGKPEPDPPEEVAVEEPDPPQGEFVEANQPAAVAWTKPENVQEELPPKPTKGDQWRVFAKIASWEGLPPSAFASSQKKQARFVWINASEHPSEGPRGMLLAPTYPAFLPHPQLRKWLAQMPAAAIVRPQDPARLAAIEARTRAVPAPRKQWVDDDGWRWIAERAAVEVPDFTSVLMDYPVAAPWTQWTMAPPPPPIAPMRPLPPSGAGPVNAEPPTSGARPLPNQVQAMPTQPGQSPAIQPAPSLPRSAPPPPAANPYPPSYAAAPASGPAYLSPVAPAAGPSSPAGSAGPSGAYPAGMMPYPAFPTTYAVPQPWGAGLAWREVPPPFFSALVDIAHDLLPIPLEPVQLDIPPQPAPAEPVAAANRPRLGVSFDAGLPWVDCQGDPSEDLAALSGGGPQSHVQPRTLWRRNLVLPAPVDTIADPRVPTTAPPRFVLAMRPAPPLPRVDPVLMSARWNS